MTTEAERRHKRAHWRASARLIETHRGEFLRLLSEEQEAEDARRDGARLPLPARLNPDGTTS